MPVCREFIRETGTPGHIRVFGTLERPETIRVPRRHARCFAWLLAQGTADEIDPRYARTYSLR